MAGSTGGRETRSTSLTEREIEVLALCAEGYSDKEIASVLGISVYTVGNHFRRILRKTESQSRAQAVVGAIELGWLGEELRPAVASTGFGGRGTEEAGMARWRGTPRQSRSIGPLWGCIEHALLR